MTSLEWSVFLEILSGQYGLASLGECSFSFRMASYIRSFEIPKCYTQVKTAKDFLYANFIICFEYMAGLIEKIICFLCVDPEIREEKVEELIPGSGFQIM